MNLLFLNIGTQELILLLLFIPQFLVIYTLYNIVTNNKFTNDKKLLWVVVVFLFNIIGSILYWMIETKKPEAY
ncbi:MULTISPECIES: PLDc N-terminal domain-containing protein [Sphingobacterium]|uniref:Phospholipase D-like protein n=1 Tax=Sphingobacterium detergens TaxID=1145106 RepID=A0A420BL09_SPHD1|nr:MULTISPECIES: PLDc N-terminal domain-containing protein [Sphingobacterium]RKE57352.1 phospholipase D-like protein [Sphingobacterium detergens]ULT23319.1 PLDc N-terminal domain-containing protein [Sphingobacterium sp. E70]